MNKRKLEQLLDQALPDETVVDDIRQELVEAYVDTARAEPVKDAVSIPANVPVTIITKAFFKEYLDEIGFGTFKVMVALGIITKKKSGYIEAEYGFSTLYYDNDAELITLDFHTEPR